ncbi:MAG TPA: 16S rRNA (guanine(966)-N(2))-methyltransferase RsmD [Phototrophicaceae bacterium]|nr:16S rRNA (guanine(966)-N(2))-methyltransferase RsmD [Phototrophicaceae bacterium]
MSIRVISGSAKGRQLKLVPGDSTRPVMDRVKEALFNILGRDVLESVWLDLFAGTGSIGIEALSRGATQAVFVEIDRVAAQTVQENLHLTRLAEHAVIRRADAFHLLKQPPPHSYDYIYVAPPQYKSLWQQTLQALEDNPAWIPPGTIVIVQIDPSEQTPVTLAHLEAYDERRYGKTLLWFFVAREQPADEQPQE